MACCRVKARWVAVRGGRTKYWEEGNNRGSLLPRTDTDPHSRRSLPKELPGIMGQAGFNPEAHHRCRCRIRCESHHARDTTALTGVLHLSFPRLSRRSFPVLHHIPLRIGSDRSLTTFLLVSLVSLVRYDHAGSFHSTARRWM